MSEAKERLGKVACPECGEPVPLRKNGAGTLSISCHECDFSGFAKPGTEAHRRWMAKLPAEPKGDEPPKNEGAPSKTKQPFSLGQL